MLRDDDTEAHITILNLNPYGGIEVEREECVNYAINKMMGTAFQNLSKSVKLGGKSQGRLIQTKCQTFQNSYRDAILSHIGDPDGV